MGERKYYRINVAGLDRDLPICEVNEHLDIAGFVIMGDVELTEKCAEQLIKLMPEHDLMITAESKGIPLIHELARQQREAKYIVARKAAKLYMQDVFSVKVNSITTDHQQILCLDGDDADAIRGKRIVIIDDVISTGESLKALEALVNEAGGSIVGKLAILAEGEAANRSDIRFLQKLPVFPK